MTLVKVRRASQMTLPREIRDSAHQGKRFVSKVFTFSNETRPMLIVNLCFWRLKKQRSLKVNSCHINC